MVQDDDLELYKQMVLGAEAQKFWTSELGKFILKRSLGETEAIRTQFKTVEASNPLAILKLQNDWKVAEQALVWIQEAIMAGNQAKLILEDKQEK